MVAVWAWRAEAPFGPASIIWLDAAWAEDLETPELLRWVRVLQAESVSCSRPVWVFGDVQLADSPWRLVLTDTLAEPPLAGVSIEEGM